MTMPACAAAPGQNLPLVWGLPFVGVLLSLSLLPVFAEKIWHAHYGKISFAWTLTMLIPYFILQGDQATYAMLTHTLLDEYLPFVIILFALFTITGGIRIKGRWSGCPESNTGLLVTGAALASFIGTTGASMLFIHPLIKANKWRQHKTHTMVFFIFLVSNIGGALTPLGDPPLFLGFLMGVPFFWPLLHMWDSFLLVAIPVIAIYYFMDRHFYAKEDLSLHVQQDQPFSISGKFNIILLAGVMGLVLLSGSWRSGVDVELYKSKLTLEELIRDVGLILLAIISLVVSKKEDRKANEFQWEPIVEILKIFLAIFITVTPVIAMLNAGETGPFNWLLQHTHTENGINNVFFFWVTGLLSSFLDNAPTYLVFFHVAGGDPAILTTTMEKTLMSISEGAVFMGAMTYIGNAPNFMVRSIAEKRGIKMPSFFGYMAWSFGILAPLFLLLTYVYVM